MNERSRLFIFFNVLAYCGAASSRGNIHAERLRFCATHATFGILVSSVEALKQATKSSRVGSDNVARRFRGLETAASFYTGAMMPGVRNI
jgi:hypothetical protein